MPSGADTHGIEEGGDELPLDANFVEQAEYLPEERFLELSAEHPDEESIVRRLSLGGAKLLVGPRGCGKTTLMLKAYYGLLRNPEASTFPVYVNFKLSLKLEPLYINTPNAPFWFRMWLTLKIYEGVLDSIERAAHYETPEDFPSKPEIASAIAAIEAGRLDANKVVEEFTTDGLARNINRLLSLNSLARCVLLLDDAAHAFSPKQQEDFFEFFRQVKSREISPKAAIYPGITSHSPTFHVGHDAEQIDVWVRPDRKPYIGFMRALAEKRFGGQLPASIEANPQAIEFLAFVAFGIPRSFLNMLRTIYHEDSGNSPTVDRRRLLDIAKQGRELSHNVYDSLSYKVPSYKIFVSTGQAIYGNILEVIKRYNRERPFDDQALEVGIKRPISPEIEKVLGFLQYAGLLMPVGENSRGVKGVFELYLVHFGDLVTENAIIGRRTKSVSMFVTAFAAQTHQAWPRVSPESLVKPADYPELFRLTLPHCQSCGAERASEHARFCQNCGAQLKTTSLYDELVNQDISVLPLSRRMVTRIKDNSNIRKIKDILIDTKRTSLRGIKFIGEVRAAHIATCAEEHVA
ncbi:hypothetical protein [Mesorhizobium sp. ES1-3]|uniref:hypothetical protein n=1 Tax=Mesorhizobium sp. ES1-3 TaxID=2876628 RepID=UPI001CCBDB01|nr:hypothetical protein [Mesorhizobium sp. ES1-3]MBZ9674084.1 hypothetical protein [Mesorhizobium sp. ES1-3]